MRRFFPFILCAALFGANASCVQLSEPVFEGLDRDGDGIPDVEDDLPKDENEILDTDRDGIGNESDEDDDGDGCPDASDLFPLNPTECKDFDKDGVGDNADLDDDSDGDPDRRDDRPGDASWYGDTDGDGVADVLDGDDDDDGILDVKDAFPFDEKEWADHDHDGIGDNADPDDDNDVDPDSLDPDPKDKTKFTDRNKDGRSDYSDSDQDGVFYHFDKCPKDPSEVSDADGDKVCNIADPDDDNDGVPDESDDCPLDKDGWRDLDGDGACDIRDDDDDNDGLRDSADRCPTDPLEFANNDGDGLCDNADLDDDNDGCPDAVDDQPFNGALCDDGDRDGVADALDAFPSDPTEWSDGDGDGYGDRADCGDADHAVNPGRLELCDNGKDDDCDGYSDGLGCLVFISGGVFDMGPDADGDGEGAMVSPEHDVRLSDYYLDKYEVTNADYGACVDAGACPPPDGMNSHFGNPIYLAAPVVFVNWPQARDYCDWAGKRLPTEAEFEYAARNGPAEDDYPWGNAGIDATKANYFDGTNLAELADVYTFPGGSDAFGAMHLLGNAAEWVADSAGDYPMTADALVTDPDGPVTGPGADKIHRGGSASSTAGLLDATDRFFADPAVAFPDIGFRCASHSPVRP